MSAAARIHTPAAAAVAAPASGGVATAGREGARGGDRATNKAQTKSGSREKVPKSCEKRAAEGGVSAATRDLPLKLVLLLLLPHAVGFPQAAFETDAQNLYSLN